MSNVNIKDRSCELVLAKLQVVGKPDFYVGSFYQHKNLDTASTQTLRENLQEIIGKEQMKNLVLADDFNLPSINLENNEISSPSQYGRDVNQMALDLCNDLFLRQVVEEPTRGRNILDLLFVSCPDLIQFTLSQGSATTIWLLRGSHWGLGLVRRNPERFLCMIRLTKAFLLPISLPLKMRY